MDTSASSSSRVTPFAIAQRTCGRSRPTTAPCAMSAEITIMLRSRHERVSSHAEPPIAFSASSAILEPKSLVSSSATSATGSSSWPEYTPAATLLRSASIEGHLQLAVLEDDPAVDLDHGVAHHEVAVSL